MELTKEYFDKQISKLATKEELKQEVAKFATKDELKQGIAKLASKDDLHNAEVSLKAYIHDAFETQQVYIDARVTELTEPFKKRALKKI